MDPPRPLRDSTVVLTDDNPVLREVLSMVLRPAVAELLLASDGVECVEAVRAYAPDLVLLDLNMPRMDGWTAIRVLREDESACPPIVVALTADASPRTRERALEVGFDGFLVRPVEPHTLVPAVEAAYRAAQEARRRRCRDGQDGVTAAMA